MDTKKNFCYDYARPAVACDNLIVSKHNNSVEILLIQRKGEPCAGMWALPGGFLEENETAEEGAARELLEETGVKISADKLILVSIFSKPNRDPRTHLISLSYLAYVDKNIIEHKAGDDASNTAWHDLNNLPEMAFDHAEIIESAKRKKLL